MSKTRRLLLAVCLAAVLGLSASEARAGNVTLTLTWAGGTTGPIDFTSPFAQLGSTADLLTIDTSVLNAFIGGNGSDFMFSELGASSNNPGDPTGSVLRETGTGVLSGTGGDQNISIVASQDGFMQPSGAGTLTSQSTANFSGTEVGSQMSNGSLDSKSTAFAMYGPPGGFGVESTGAVGNAAGYTLIASTAMDLTGSAIGASDQMSNRVMFVNSVSAPEPTSLVMLAVGMPLSLVVLRRVRRRRAAG
jgi:hypothetical protein